MCLTYVGPLVPELKAFKKIWWRILTHNSTLNFSASMMHQPLGPALYDTKFPQLLHKSFSALIFLPLAHLKGWRVRVEFSSNRRNLSWWMRRDRSWPKRCRRRDLMWPSLHHQQHQHHQQKYHKHQHHHPHHLQQLIIIAELSSEFCGQKQFCKDILGRFFNMRLVRSWKACFFQVQFGPLQDACPSLLIDYKPREQEKCLQSPIMEAAESDTMKQNRMKTDSCIPSYTHPLTTSILWSRWRWCRIVYSYCSLYKTLLPRQSTINNNIWYKCNSYQPSPTPTLIFQK